MVPLLVLLALMATAAPVSAEPLPFQVVLPTGAAHELLPKTCGVCHKGDARPFFVVSSGSPEGLDRALALLSSGPGPGSAPQRPQNPHQPIACLFCHLDVPEPGAPRDTLSFRTLEGKGVGPGEVEHLCRMCHPDPVGGHPRVLGTGDPSKDLVAAGLPLPPGGPTCATCHEMHQSEAGPAAVRLGYLAFADQSRTSFPHGNRAACGACHQRPVPPAGTPPFRISDDALRCKRCHPTGHERIHPVAVRATPATYPMDFLEHPLGADGQTTCATCHDHPCASDVDPKNRAFLRGGPFAPFTDFCYRCHPKAGAGGLNPHRQLNDRGEVQAATCAFCHRKPPQDREGGDFDPKDLLFLHSPVELCMGCHDPGPHPSGNHLVELGPAMRARLEEYERRHRVKLPLGPNHRAVCTTCHNPHEKGVLLGKAALGAGEEKGWRVPSFAELCTPCHGRIN